MEENRSFSFKERSADELIGLVGSDMQGDGQYNHIRLPQASVAPTQHLGPFYPNENMTPLLPPPLSQNVMPPGMVDIRGGDYVIFGAPHPHKPPNGYNLNYANKTNATFTGFNSYGMDYPTSNYNLFNGIPPQRPHQPVLQYPQNSERNAKAQLIENLVGNWASDQSGTYSPFGTPLGGVRSDFIENISIGRGKRNFPSQTQIVAEVVPMTPSYSDVLAKSIPESTNKQSKTKPIVQNVKPKTIRAKPSKFPVSRTLSGYRNLINKQTPGENDSNCVQNANNRRNRSESDGQENLSKKWLSLDDLKNPKKRENYIKLNNKNEKYRRNRSEMSGNKTGNAKVNANAKASANANVNVNTNSNANSNTNTSSNSNSSTNKKTTTNNNNNNNSSNNNNNNNNNNNGIHNNNHSNTTTNNNNNSNGNGNNNSKRSRKDKIRGNMPDNLWKMLAPACYSLAFCRTMCDRQMKKLAAERKKRKAQERSGREEASTGNSKYEYSGNRTTEEKRSSWKNQSQKNLKQNSRNCQSEKHEKTVRTNRKEQETCISNIIKVHLDRYGGMLLFALSWLLWLVIDVLYLSTYLAIHMCLTVWAYSTVNVTHVYKKCCQSVRNVELLKRIMNWRFFPFRRSDRKKKAYNSDEDSNETEGLKQNIELPQTGEEAIRRLLALGKEDPYIILGVTRDCTDEDIKKYYKRQAFLLHPDKNKQPEAEEAFKMLTRAFSRIGQPKQRKLYDSKCGNGLRSKSPEDWIAEYKKKNEFLANTMRCMNCKKHHKKIAVSRPLYAARMCSQCKIHHSVREGDIWAETSMFGLIWHYYACIDGVVNDVTKWASCQGKNLKNLKANTHNVQYRIVNVPRTKIYPPVFPSDFDVEDFINDFIAKSDARGDGSETDKMSLSGKRQNSKRKNNKENSREETEGKKKSVAF